jgi:hypothetical protein
MRPLLLRPARPPSPWRPPRAGRGAGPEPCPGIPHSSHLGARIASPSGRRMGESWCDAIRWPRPQRGAREGGDRHHPWRASHIRNRRERNGRRIQGFFGPSPLRSGDERVRIKMGNAFDVVGERVQRDFRTLASNLYEVEWEVSLRNHKTAEQTVTVIESVPGDWQVPVREGRGSHSHVPHPGAEGRLREAHVPRAPPLLSHGQGLLRGPVLRALVGPAGLVPPRRRHAGRRRWRRAPPPRGRRCVPQLRCEGRVVGLFRSHRGCSTTLVRSSVPPSS